MKNFQAKLRRFGMAWVLFFLIFAFLGNTAQIFAHGDEDHGDEKPKTTSGEQGTILHTTRLGSLEVSLKHPPFAPDTQTSGRLFVTRFETNEPFDKAQPVMEIEGANGSVVQAAIEKGENAGSYTIRFPALPQGVYTIRAKLTYAGETDTATFSGVEVSPVSVAAAESSALSWARTLLIAFIFLVVLALLGGLVYFVLRFSESEPMKKETVSV
jgi:hypothetical protein